MNAHGKNSTLPGAQLIAHLVMCLCFLLVSTVMPAYSAGLSPHVIPVSNVNFPHDTDLLLPGSNTMTGQAQHDHHPAPENPCDHPACDIMVNCTDTCTMSLCSGVHCVSSGVFSSALLTGEGTSPYLPAEDSPVLSRRTGPLFRPPIQ